MPIFAPGVAQGVLDAQTSIRQQAEQRQQQAAQKQAMDYQAWQMQQQRQQAATQLQAQQGIGPTMSAMYPVPTVGNAQPNGPAPAPAPGFNSAQQAPTASPGSPPPPSSAGSQPQGNPVPAYRTVANTSAPTGQPQGQGGGPMAVPPVQSQQQPNSGYLERFVAAMRASKKPESEWGAQLEAIAPGIKMAMADDAEKLKAQGAQFNEQLKTFMVQLQADRLAGQEANWKSEDERRKAITAKGGAELAIKERKAAGAGSGSGGAPTGSSSKLTGEALLASLKPGEANMVKAISEGRLPLSAVGYKDKTRIGELVAAYKGDYDAATYPTRQAVVKDFTSGPTAKNITALNTGIGHLGTLSELGKALKTGDVKALNGAYNKISSEFGVANVNNFEIARDAVANEMVRIFRQVGSSDAETAKWESTFKSSASPEQMSGSIKTAVDLLGSRLSALNEQWNRGTGETEGFKNILDPKSKKVLESMGVSTGKPAAQGAGPYSDADKEARYQAWKKQHASQ